MVRWIRVWWWGLICIGLVWCLWRWMRRGRQLGAPVRVVNDPGRLVAAATRHAPCPRLVPEATYGWYLRFPRTFPGSARQCFV
jgi:hypothetical protein